MYLFVDQLTLGNHMLLAFVGTIYIVMRLFVDTAPTLADESIFLERPLSIVPVGSFCWLIFLMRGSRTGREHLGQTASSSGGSAAPRASSDSDRQNSSQVAASWAAPMRRRHARDCCASMGVAEGLAQVGEPRAGGRGSCRSRVQTVCALWKRHLRLRAKSFRQDAAGANFQGDLYLDWGGCFTGLGHGSCVRRFFRSSPFWDGRP